MSIRGLRPKRREWRTEEPTPTTSALPPAVALPVRDEAPSATPTLRSAAHAARRLRYDPTTQQQVARAARALDRAKEAEDPQSRGEPKKPHIFLRPRGRDRADIMIQWPGEPDARKVGEVDVRTQDPIWKSLQLGETEQAMRAILSDYGLDFGAGALTGDGA